MRPVEHLVHATWFSLLLATVLDLPTVAVALLSSLLIDIDHWLWSIWAFGHWSPLAATRWHKAARDDLSCFNFHICCVFHTVEFLAALGAVAIVSPLARGVFLGCLFHVACDLVDHFLLWPEARRIVRVKFLLTPFIPKLARGEIYARREPSAAGRR